MKTYNEKRVRYFQMDVRNQGVSQFEKMKIYGLNIAMAIFATPFFTKRLPSGRCQYQGRWRC
jgi:hypothetical protein